MEFDWAKTLDAAVTVCDSEGIIIFMNEQSSKIFTKDGGYALIGKNLLDCHPGSSKQKLENLLTEPRVNMYTIEKKGIKKFIYQTPWYKDGQFGGLVEISFVLDKEIPHFVRS